MHVVAPIEFHACNAVILFLRGFIETEVVAVVLFIRGVMKRRARTCAGQKRDLGSSERLRMRMVYSAEGLCKVK